MSKDIRIKKGLDIRLKGEPDKALTNAPRSRTFVINPQDFHLFTPKMLAKEGQHVQAGDPIFYTKEIESIKIVSPVSGILKEIKRGAKRKITQLIIDADSEDSYRDFGITNVATSDAESIKSILLESGCWPFIKQRPYDVIANPNHLPKSIFISAHASAPLVADFDFTLTGKEKELQTAIDALAKLTTGKIHVGVGADGSSPMINLNGIVLHKITGPHPSGNVGTLINKIDPINKGEIVWVVNPHDLVIIGQLLLTGKFNAERIVALSGSSVKTPKYYKSKIGAEVATMVYDSGLTEEHVRFISGGVLTGTKISAEGHLAYYDHTITVIPEGDDYEFFGWNKPMFNKISLTRALTFSWLTPKKKFVLNTNTNGEHRAFVQTGMYEQVFPLDMYPLQILKACMVEDLDAMEQLGLFEVAPEDFALTEFVCVSKQPHQEIIRKGLDLMYKEIG